LVVLVGTVFPMASVAASELSERSGVGLTHHVALPWIAVLGVAIGAQTFAAYWVHRWMHGAPLLWRIHRVHHADSAVDVSTSLRNHPLELLVTLPVSALVTFVIGAPVSVVVAVQTIIVAAALWQHADIALPRRLDRALSRVIFTPRLHRLHHNPERAIHDSNFGELIILWDRLFGTLNLSETRGEVGLEGQATRPDRLIDQICSPLYSA
jgi:sterol desaturase/sphingolipid hydroxylase (fatty acid hydroxylase superfamily)